MSGHGDSTRAIFFALGANFSITVVKGIAAAVTGSGAMLAETVHSFADCGNQGLLLLGLRKTIQIQIRIFSSPSTLREMVALLFARCSNL